jgi:hypothetical protein
MTGASGAEPMSGIAIRTRGLLLALTLASAAAPALAETASDRAACTPSVLMLCPREALSMNRQAALQCLLANLSRATPQCQAVVHALVPASTTPVTRPGRLPR